MENFNKYLNMNDNDIDNLLLGLDLNKKNKIDKQEKWCTQCKSDKLVFDKKQGHNVCQNCGTVNLMILDDKPDFNQKDATSNYG